jgi:DNA helicase-2/ATP-dependent DNA helicase PcrA
MARVNVFRELIEKYMSIAATENAEEVGRGIVVDSGIYADVHSSSDAEDLVRQENVDELVSGLSDFVQSRLEEDNNNVTITDYLSEVSLLSDLDSDKGGDEHKITLMTIHSAKGLEFPTVFVVGLEENLFPSQMACESMREMEEERRLFYVAITRAERHCFLSYAKSRYRYGKMEFGNPSRFLSDIAPEYLDRHSTVKSSFGRSADVELPWKRKTNVYNDEPEFMRSNNAYSRPAAPSRTVSMPNISGGVSSFTPKVHNTDAFTPVTGIRRVSKVTDANVTNASAKSPEASASIAVGKHIEHQRFGIGVVEKIEGTGDQMKATINFNNLGKKQLLLKFARFKVID